MAAFDALLSLSNKRAEAGTQLAEFSGAISKPGRPPLSISITVDYAGEVVCWLDAEQKDGWLQFSLQTWSDTLD